MRLRRIVLIGLLLCVALLIVSPLVIYHRRTARFDSVCALVAGHGGHLSFDLQGDYFLTLKGPAASEGTIEQLLPYLRALPSGFTIIGPGEGRHFYVQINESNITARTLTNLCSLPITSITLKDCPNLHDDAADALVTLQNPYAIINGNVPLSPGALLRLRHRMQNVFLSEGG